MVERETSHKEVMGSNSAQITPNDFKALKSKEENNGGASLFCDTVRDREKERETKAWTERERER